MGVFTLMRDVAKAKLDKLSQGNEPKIERTSVPLGLHQGSAVELPEVELALAQADGSILPQIVLNQTIIAVGSQTLFGKLVYNCYLSDGTSFLRVVTDKGEAKEVTLFTGRDEVHPSSQEDWEFWLGRYAKDSTGEWVRDPNTGKGVIAEYGLIGWPQFQIDGPPVVVYNRAWNPSNEGTEPVEYTETVVFEDGRIVKVKHEAQEYVRQIGNIVESLFVTMAQSGNEASIDIFVGIPLTIKDIKVLASI